VFQPSALLRISANLGAFLEIKSIGAVHKSSSVVAVLDDGEHPDMLQSFPGT
jgi:hypothetical protein